MSDIIKENTTNPQELTDSDLTQVDGGIIAPIAKKDAQPTAIVRPRSETPAMGQPTGIFSENQKPQD